MAQANPLGLFPAPRGDDPVAIEGWAAHMNRASGVLQQGTIKAVHEAYCEIEPLRNRGDGSLINAMIPVGYRGLGRYAVGCVVLFQNIFGGSDVTDPDAGLRVDHAILDPGCQNLVPEEHGHGYYYDGHGICVAHGEQDVTCGSNSVKYRLEMQIQGPTWVEAGGPGCDEGFCPNAPVYMPGQCIGDMTCNGCEECDHGHGDHGHGSVHGDGGGHGHGDHGHGDHGIIVEHGGDGFPHGGDGDGGHGVDTHGDGDGLPHGGYYDPYYGGYYYDGYYYYDDLVFTECCPEGIPKTLHATANDDPSNGCAGSGMSDCTYPGSTLTWDESLQRWVGPTPFQGPGGDYELHVFCSGGSGFFSASLYQGETLIESISPVGGTCDPLVINMQLDDENVPGIVCCNGGPITIDITVTA